jgi:hypothetical protein
MDDPTPIDRWILTAYNDLIVCDLHIRRGENPLVGREHGRDSGARRLERGPHRIEARGIAQDERPAQT